MPAVVVFSIEIDRICRLPSMHETAQIGLRCLNDQVHVVCHQTVQIQSNIIESAALCELADKTLAVVVCCKNAAAIVPTDGYVVYSPLIDNT